MKEDKHIDMHDTFTDQIRQKLENHTMPVDADVWKGIQQKLAPRKRIIPWWAYVSVSAAAGIALIFTLGNFFMMNDQPAEVSSTANSNNEIVVQKEHQEIIKSLEKSSEDIFVAALQTRPTSRIDAIVEKKKQEASVADDIQPLIDASTPAEEVAVAITIPSAEKEEDLSEATAENKSSTLNTLKEKVEKLEADWTDVIKKKEDKRVLLAAGLGSGIGSSSVSLPGRSRAFRHESLVDLNTSYNNVLTPNDFKNKEYLPPVTVGLSVRLPLNDLFSLESGLSYTYLTTRLSGNSTADYTAVLDLHYVGLPLNIITSLMSEKHWEIYVSTGTTIEKGLRSDFKQYEDYGNTLYATEANTSIDGIQMSVNASLGISYRLNQNLSVYLDPKLSYYFENDQPFSIRSELPMLFGLNTGLRMLL
jgi:hypothetical protein